MADLTESGPAPSEVKEVKLHLPEGAEVPPTSETAQEETKEQPAEVPADDEAAKKKTRLAELRVLFDHFDTDGGGSISTEELGAIVRKLGQNPTDGDLEAMVDEVDEDNSGEIEFDEFVKMMSKKDGEVLCRTGHTMKAFEANVATIECDLCQENSAVGSTLYACGLCSFLRCSRPECLSAEMEKNYYDPSFGCAFSGGGIRSASLCSGALYALLSREELEKKIAAEDATEKDALTKPALERNPTAITAAMQNVWGTAPSLKRSLPKTFSCVSGGGYVGSSYLWWSRLHRGMHPNEWKEQYFQRIRNRVGYYVDWRNPVQGFIDVLMCGGLLVMLSVLACCIITPYIFLFVEAAGPLWWSIMGEPLFALSVTPVYMLPVAYICFGGPVWWVLASCCRSRAKSDLKNVLDGGDAEERAREAKALKVSKTWWDLGATLEFEVSLIFFLACILVVELSLLGQREFGSGRNETYVFLRFIMLFAALKYNVWAIMGWVTAHFMAWVYSPHHLLFGVLDHTTFDEDYHRFALWATSLLFFKPFIENVSEKAIFHFSRWRLQRTFYNSPEDHLKAEHAKNKKESVKRSIGGTMAHAVGAGIKGRAKKLTQKQYQLTHGKTTLSSEKKRRMYLFCGQDEDGSSDSPIFIAGTTVNNWSFVNPLGIDNYLAHFSEGNPNLNVEEMRSSVLKDTLECFHVPGASYDIMALSSEGFWERYEDKLMEPVVLIGKHTPQRLSASMDIRRYGGSNVVSGADPCLKLTDAMCLSAAAGSYNNGDVGDAGNAKNVQILLGAHMGKWVVTKAAAALWKRLFLKFVVNMIIMMPLALKGFYMGVFTAPPTHVTVEQQLLMDGGISYDIVYDTRETNVSTDNYMGVFTFGLLFLWVAIWPFFKLTFPNALPYVPYLRLVLAMSSHTWWTHEPPPLVYVSDGGHTENLGLLALLSRRMSTMVSVCGAEDPNDDGLKSLLLQGRDKLGLSFSTVEADQDRRGSARTDDVLRDVDFFSHSDTQRVIVLRVHYRATPRTVEHADKEFPWKAYWCDKIKQEQVSTGLIYYVKPVLHHAPDFLKSGQPSLHADHGVKTMVKGHESLGGCCCRCCHRFPALAGFSGEFPYHATSYQFFTPELFDAYHSQGAQGVMDAFKACESLEKWGNRKRAEGLDKKNAR